MADTLPPRPPCCGQLEQPTQLLSCFGNTGSWKREKDKERDMNRSSKINGGKKKMKALVRGSFDYARIIINPLQLPMTKICETSLASKNVVIPLHRQKVAKISEYAKEINCSGLSHSCFRVLFQKRLLPCLFNVWQVVFTSTIFNFLKNLSVFLSSHANFYEINQREREVSKI